MSNINKWNIFYDGFKEIKSYADDTTYALGWKFLKDCSSVEDWGCGFCYFGTYVPEERYIGIDGSNSHHAKIKADLEEYVSKTPGLFMRHILEHNYQWDKILKNAIESFQERMVLVIFTPFQEITSEIAYNQQVQVPDIAFNKQDLINHFSHLEWTEISDIKTGSQYGVETIFYIKK